MGQAKDRTAHIRVCIRSFFCSISVTHFDRTVAVDADQTELSRELYRAFEADETFGVIGMTGTEEEAMKRVEEGDASVALIIPAGLEQNDKAGRDAEVLQSTQITMLIAVPSFMLSGYTWPLQSMPTAVAAIGKSLPLTYSLDGAREIVTKGHGLSAVKQDLLVLAFMTLVSLFAAYLIYMFQKRKTVKIHPESDVG